MIGVVLLRQGQRFLESLWLLFPPALVWSGEVVGSLCVLASGKQRAQEYPEVDMKSQNAKRLVVLVALTLLPWACSPKQKDETAKTPPPPEEQALVRFVNATTYTQPVDLYRDEAKVLPD